MGYHDGIESPPRRKLNNLRVIDRETGFLLPPSDEWLPETHLARFVVEVIEGPHSEGHWTMEPEGAGARVHFSADFDGPRLLAPVMRRVIARQFRGYHEHLRHQLERGGW